MLDLVHTIPAPVTFVVGVALLLLGGNWLVDGAVTIARRLRWSTLLIGLTLVAFGTSAPELAFNVTAALSGTVDLSFGNVIGSNIANIALVLGLAAMVSPLLVHGRVIRRELPLLIVATALTLVLAWTHWGRAPEGFIDGFTRVDGLILLIGFMFVTWLWYRLGRQDRADPLALEAQRAAGASGKPSLPPAIIQVACGLLALVAGGKGAEMGAVGIAAALGISQALIGLTVVALATSLPEVVTSVIAARKGHCDLAVGNVVGSNLFNLLLVLGVTAVIKPVPVPVDHGWWDLLAMMVLTVALVPISLSYQRRVVKYEGIFLLMCYVAYIAYRIIRQLSTTL